MRCVIALLAVAWLGITPLAGCAQNTGDDARQALRSGDYEAARAAFKDRLAGPDSSRADAVAGYVETFLATGAYDEGLRAIDALLDQAIDDPYLLHGRGQLLVAVGRYDEAGEAFQQAGQHQPDYWRNALDLADLLVATGRRRPARQIYAALFDRYQRGIFRTAEALGVGGRAAAALEDFHEANSAFRTAYQIDPTNVQILTWWADLFREKYNTADAQRTYEEALALNPSNADLYVGLARSTNGFGKKEELARRALDVNPNLVDALNILAGLRILDGQYAEAEAFVERALGVNPASVEALAHQASAHWLRGEPDAFEQVEHQALAVNPQAASFYVTVAENLALRFRYPDAAALARKAVEVDPEDPAAYAALGTGLLRMGEVDAARRALERSFRADPFNLFVGNTLTLLDEYADFDLLESAHFRLLIHRDESAVLGPAILDEAEAAYQAFSARYPYAPDGPIRLEAYNDRDDFAVRVAGLPHLGLLGVCFGDVVALNTPRAQQGRNYNWARTLWHELAHTMAIGTSDFHVPRWFTEGLSVHEEQRARPAWGRDMDLELFTAFDQDKLLPLDAIDRGFTRPQFPGQVILSYYHASKVIGFIEEQHGFEAITGILGALGQGLPIDQAIKQTTGQSMAALDDAFRADLQRRRDAFDQVLADLPDVLDDEEEQASLLDKLSGRSENPFLQRLQQGREALEREDYGTAETRFREALAIYPNYTGAGNPYTGLAAVYRARDERSKLIDVLERFLRVSEYGAAEARELADLYAEDGDAEQAIRHLERSLEVEPYDLPTHDRLATLYAQRARHDRAVRARRAILALDPVDEARAYYDLAASLYDAGAIPQAKRAVLQSLERAPGFREAQKLLLACVERSE